MNFLFKLVLVATLGRSADLAKPPFYIMTSVEIKYFGTQLTKEYKTELQGILSESKSFISQLADKVDEKESTDTKWDELAISITEFCQSKKKNKYDCDRLENLRLKFYKKIERP